jgi:hypothetical protein
VRVIYGKEVRLEIQEPLAVEMRFARATISSPSTGTLPIGALAHSKEMSKSARNSAILCYIAQNDSVTATPWE